jgi:putative transposase
MTEPALDSPLSTMTRRQGLATICYGPELSSQVLDRWACERGETLGISQPGKPTDRAFVKSFNGRLREVCLGAPQFMSLKAAEAGDVGAWRQDFNAVRRHSALGHLTPQMFAAREARKPCS